MQKIKRKKNKLLIPIWLNLHKPYCLLKLSLLPSRTLTDICPTSITCLLIDQLLAFLQVKKKQKKSSGLHTCQKSESILIQVSLAWSVIPSLNKLGSSTCLALCWPTLKIGVVSCTLYFSCTVSLAHVMRVDIDRNTPLFVVMSSNMCKSYLVNLYFLGNYHIVKLLVQFLC